jgi:transcriptional regulator with XRE-family HTH domain
MTTNRIRELRRRANLTLMEIAARVGVSYQHISSIERAETPLTHQMMCLLAPHLGVRPAALIDPLADHVTQAQLARDIVDDAEERAWLTLWRRMPDDMRIAALKLLSANAAALRGNTEAA